jgi:hypothetical protein
LKPVKFGEQYVLMYHVLLAKNIIHEIWKESAIIFFVGGAEKNGGLVT